MRSKRWIAGFMAAALLVLAGCAGSTKKEEPTPAATTTPAPAPASEAPKKAPVELTVWTKFEKAQDIVKQVSADWAAKTGNKVNVIYFEQSFQEFLPIAAAGKGPDVYFGLPHDNLGTFQKAGLLEAVPNGIMNDSDFPKGAIESVSYDGKKYAVPVTIEALGLIYNKKLVPAPPKTYDEFLTVAKEKGFAFDAANFYFAYGFLAGNGGFVFEQKGGALDPKSVGLGNDGSKAGLKLIHDLAHTHKLFPADVNYDYMQGNFEAGKIGMMLNGPWGIDGVKKANIDVGVAPMPTLPNGKPFAPFIGVYAGFVASASQKKEAAWDYMKYMLENAPLKMYPVGKRLPAMTKQANDPIVTSDPLTAGFVASAASGTPMPNIPEVAAMWSPGADMLRIILDNKAPIDQASADAVAKINEAVKAQK